MENTRLLASSNCDYLMLTVSILTFNTVAPARNSTMFMWPLSSATSWGVFCSMEKIQNPFNMADEKGFILTYSLS